MSLYLKLSGGRRVRSNASFRMSSLFSRLDSNSLFSRLISLTFLNCKHIFFMFTQIITFSTIDITPAKGKKEKFTGNSVCPAGQWTIQVFFLGGGIDCERDLHVRHLKKIVPKTTASKLKVS